MSLGPGIPTPLRPPPPENAERHRMLDGHRIRRRAVVGGVFTTNTGWKRRRRDYWTTFSRTTGIRFNFTVTPLLNCKTPANVTPISRQISPAFLPASACRNA